MTISLNDIAERAGVSVKTVSGALHGGSARMSDDTRLRIKEIAEELGYVTNFAARSMRQGWMPLIGVIADELVTSPFATGIIGGLDSGARAADMAVFAMTLSGRRNVGLGAGGDAPVPPAGGGLRCDVSQAGGVACGVCRDRRRDDQLPRGERSRDLAGAG